MAVLFATCVCILAAGFVWFYVVRPILEDYGVIEPRVMSRDSAEADSEYASVLPVVTAFTTVEQSIVTPNNEYSGALSDNERTQFEVRALTIASLYEAGIVTNLSKAICRAYGCTVQSASKSDSTYQMALKAVNKHLPKKDTGPQFRERTPEQEALRQQLRLEK